MASFTVSYSSNCRGGSAYSDRSYVICVDTGSKNQRLNQATTEALLIKQDGPCNLENIKIRTSLKVKTYTSVADYISGVGNVLETPTPWAFVKVLVGNRWIKGPLFYTNTQPSTDSPQEPSFVAESCDKSRPNRQNACSVVPEDTNHHEDDDIEVSGDAILPATAPEIERPIDRSFADYPGMSEEYRVRFRPVSGVHSPGTWSGNGVISRQGYYQNCVTKNGYHNYTIRLDKMAQTHDKIYDQNLYSVSEYAEIGLGQWVEAVDAWSRIEIKVGDRWMLGTFAAKKLFNIEVKENQHGVLIEYRGLSPEN